MSTSGSAVPVLGESPFNYVIYTPSRFVHYYQQIQRIMRLAPSRMLEIGPGDHTVTDFLRRKGIAVKTFDQDAKLFPDYRGDIRQKLPIQEKFDLVLASEVFEHMNIKWLGQILENIREVLVPGGHLVVSLPYSTLRLFPKIKDYGSVVSCEGRLRTHIPMRYAQPVIDVWMGFYRILFKRCFRSAFRFHKWPEYPDDRFDVHHWDLGYAPTTRKFVRAIFERHFTVVEEDPCVDTNVVFFILKKP